VWLGYTSRRSNNRSSSADQLDKKNNQRNHKQDMNESAQRVTAHDSEQPQDQEDYKNCPEHLLNLPLSLSALISTTNLWTPRARFKVVYPNTGIRRAVTSDSRTTTDDVSASSLHQQIHT
jgi:hypothetical protein